MFTFKSKTGSVSFARKLQKLIATGRVSKARYLLQEHNAKFGESIWNPGYGLLRECGAQCAYTGEPIGH